MPDAEGNRISATEAALGELATLRDRHGPLVLHQSGGCCDGSSPLCLHEGELLLAPGDRLLGELDGVPMYIDAEQDDRWNRPTFVLDLSRTPGLVLARGGGRCSLRDALARVRGARRIDAHRDGAAR